MFIWRIESAQESKCITENKQSVLIIVYIWVSPNFTSAHHLCRCFYLPAHSERVTDWICSVFWLFNRLFRVLTTPEGKSTAGSQLGNLVSDWRRAAHLAYLSSHSACRAPFDSVACAHSGLPRPPCSASCWQRHKKPTRHLWRAAQHLSAIGRESHQRRAARTRDAASFRG